MSDLSPLCASKRASANPLQIYGFMPWFPMHNFQDVRRNAMTRNANTSSPYRPTSDTSSRRNGVMLPT
jgi:hypothetical protein